jgi:hypothetical protein
MDGRFLYDVGGIQSIATSSGQNDSGLFELNFHDERYLPFEGAGAISRWHIQLPSQFRQFDYDTISDVIFHVKYTALDGGATFRDTVITDLQYRVNAMVHHLEETQAGLRRLFALRHEFPNEWHAFLHGDGGHSLTLKIDETLFPIAFQDRGISVQGIDVALKPAAVKDRFGAVVKFSHPGGSSDLELGKGGLGQLPGTGFTGVVLLGDWKLELTKIPGGLQGEDPGTLDPEKVEDLFLVCRYTIGGAA